MGDLLVKDKWNKAKSFLPNFWATLDVCEDRLGILKEFHFSDYLNPIGIEVETEGWPEDWAGKPTLWKAVPDGSLKDHGMELVSSILSGPIIDYALFELKGSIIGGRKLRWSHRTSIHVHNNIKHLPVFKLRWFIAWYALLEYVFFSKVEERRKGNSFCFPLNQAQPQQVYLEDWPKYCALNLGSCLGEFNTAEFRHMHGNQDWKLINEWLFMVMNFVAFISNHSMKELEEKLERYLVTGNLDLREIFRSVTLPDNVNDLLKATTKWVVQYLSREN